MSITSSTLPPPAAPPPLPLALSDYAVVAAHLLHGAGKPTADVLRDLGIHADVWRASAAVWERALDDELTRGEHALFVTFTSSFAAARSSLGRGRAPAPVFEPVFAPIPAPVFAPVSVLVESRQDAGAPSPRHFDIPDVPNLPIGPDTAIVDGRRLSQPALPFVPAPQPPPPPGDPPPPQPPPSLLIGPTTARIDARWLPPPPENPWTSGANLMEETPLPLVRARHRSHLARWAARIWRLLGLGDIRR